MVAIQFGWNYYFKEIGHNFMSQILSLTDLKEKNVHFYQNLGNLPNILSNNSFYLLQKYIPFIHKVIIIVIAQRFTIL